MISEYWSIHDTHGQWLASYETPTPVWCDRLLRHRYSSREDAEDDRDDLLRRLGIVAHITHVRVYACRELRRDWR